jgi:FkbM family methyltransferase
MLKFFKNIFSKKTIADSNTMYEGLLRSRSMMPFINTIIDVGAAEGTWYTKTNKVFSASNFILIEPLIERKSYLDKICKENKNVCVQYCALGETNSIVPFTVSDDLDGSGFYGVGNLREIKVVKLDDLIHQENKLGPYILKLDTHGYEIPILKGAEKVLENTELIIVEVYGFYVAPNSLLFGEMITYMDSIGFRLSDMNDVMRREYDKAFWQVDAFFLKKNNEIFNSNTYAKK